MKYFTKEAAPSMGQMYNTAKQFAKVYKEPLIGAAALGTYSGISSHGMEKVKEKRNPEYEYNPFNVVGNVVSGAVIGGYLGSMYMDIGAAGARSRSRSGSSSSGGAQREQPVWSDIDYLRWIDVAQENIKSKRDLTKAYRAAARKYHPDLNKAPDASKKMGKASEAYNKLKETRWFEGLKEAGLR